MRYGASGARGGGVDVALEGRPLRGLALRGTFAYNKTTFDEDSLTPNGSLLYAKGTGVPGVGSPITLSVQGDYEFTLFADRGLYAHADFSYNSEQRRAGQTSPTSSTYEPLLAPVPAYTVTNLRVGTRLLDDTLDLSLFVNNVTDSHPDLNLAFNSFLYLWTNQTLRPRTVGLTVAFRR